MFATYGVHTCMYNTIVKYLATQRAMATAGDPHFNFLTLTLTLYVVTAKLIMATNLLTVEWTCKCKSFNIYHHPYSSNRMFPASLLARVFFCADGDVASGRLLHAAVNP